MSKYTNIQDALIANGLDFNMEKRALLWQRDANVLEPVKDKVAVINSDETEYLGVVGKNYGLVPYRDSFAFLNPLLVDGMVELIRCNKTRNGARVYIQFVAPGIEEFDTETLVNGFHLFASCDGSKEIEVHIAPTRLIKDADGQVYNAGLFVTNIKPVKFRHTSLVDKHLKAAEKTYEKVVHGFASFKHDIQLLIKQRVTDEEAQGYIEVVIPGEGKATERTREAIFTNFKFGKCSGLVTCHGTLYGALTSIMSWADNCQPRKAKWIGVQDARIESAMVGTVAKKKLIAYATATQMAKTWGSIG